MHTTLTTRRLGSTDTGEGSDGMAALLRTTGAGSGPSRPR
jgi:hypothetical protein